MNQHKFRAGAFMTEITPPLGTLINGDFTTHYARTVHDPLYVKALVLHASDVTLVLVLVDICAMRKDLLDAVKVQIEQHTGVPPANVLIASTHTHASGSVEPLLLVEADLAYRKTIPEAIVSTVVRAMENLRPAKVAFGSANAPEHVVCRRFYMKNGYCALNPVTGGEDKVKTNPFGDEKYIARRVSNMDPEVAFLAVRGLDNKWISLLANYSMHYAGDWLNGTITADYFGTFSKGIGRKIGAAADFVGMMSNGTSGEANIWDFLEPERYPKEFFAKSELIGDALAQKVADALDGVKWDEQPTLKTFYRDLPLTLRKPSAEELEKAKQVVAVIDYENIRDINPETLRHIYAREQVLLSEFPEQKMFPVQAFRVGKLIVGGLGGEFFAETGLWLKENSPASKYFTVCFANDYVGYVPPAHEIENGGYETWRCRTSYLSPDSEKAIRDALLSGMQQIFRD